MPDIEKPGIISSLLKLPVIHELSTKLIPKTAGQKGYSKHKLLGIKLIRIMYNETSYEATIARVKQSAELRAAIGCSKKADVPSIWAMYRLENKLANCEEEILETAAILRDLIKQHVPEYATITVTDSTDIPAWSNGRVEPEKRSDPDANWGRRSGTSTRSSGSFYGYKAHITSCAITELPIIWQTRPADEGDSPVGITLFHAMQDAGYQPAYHCADTIYDCEELYALGRHYRCAILTPLRKSNQEEFPFVCFHGGWIRCGTDRNGMRVKYRCPKGKCKRKYRWYPATRQHPFIKRGSPAWIKIFSKRTSIERLNSRSKRQYGLDQLRGRGIAKACMHTSMIMLTQLALGVLNCANACANP